VKVWNADTGEELKSLGGHEGAVTSVVLLPEQEQLIIGAVIDNVMKNHRNTTKAMVVRLTDWQIDLQEEKLKLS
jgi:WD40 repeat protein